MPVRRWTVLASIVFVVACSSVTSTEPTNVEPETGGSSGTSGSLGSGGHVGTGGNIVGTGGHAGTGGNIAGTGGNTVATGGHAGTGGNIAGTGGSDAPPHTVLPCDQLPAKGSWESIQPVPVLVNDSQGTGWPGGIAVDPFESGALWAGIGMRGLYKSQDCGATWALVSTGRNHALINGTSINGIAVDPVDQGTIYLPGFNGSQGMWKSTNGGVDWDTVIGGELLTAMGGIVNSIGMDPTDPQHIIVTPHSPCQSSSYLQTVGSVCVVETFNGGQTWRVVNFPIPGVTGWLGGLGAFILDHNRWLLGSFNSGMWLTTDDGATFKEVASQNTGNGKTLNRPFKAQADGVYYLTSLQGMLKSDDGLSWSLIPNSGGRESSFASGDNTLFAADAYTLNYHQASLSSISTWTSMAVPPAQQVSGLGGAYVMDYDSDHHILYSSNYPGGLWRIVMK